MVPEAVLNPMAAMFGGIVGQEVVKACSGKFHPLVQVSNSYFVTEYRAGEIHCRGFRSCIVNPVFRSKLYKTVWAPRRKTFFDDTFWENLNVVINALDNVNARLYVDQRCVYFQKPLLESGTLGAKCNTQMVIPHLTENYGASRDPPEKQAPMCTVHSFPP
ncbi:putative ubiquitin-activating enzyme E1 [Helianthus annuus]|nr:putative ubiquitin-activating enzyme E1 [Helianthus annuus]